MIGYQVFKGVKYPRLMSWTAGSGRIAVGKDLRYETTSEDAENVVLPEHTPVLVMDMNFKLVPA